MHHHNLIVLNHDPLRHQLEFELELRRLQYEARLTRPPRSGRIRTLWAALARRRQPQRRPVRDAA
jgi:hypothetical protein